MIAGLIALVAAGLAVWQTAGVDSQSDSPASASVEVHLLARRLEDGRTEVALQQRQPEGRIDRIVPDARFLPADADPERWYHSSPLPVVEQAVGPGPLKIALLQTLHGSPVERRQAFKLEMADINKAGGVFGRSVVGVIADFNLDEAFIVASTRRLVEEDGVHIFAGPTFSSSSLIISE